MWNELSQTIKSDPKAGGSLLVLLRKMTGESVAKFMAADSNEKFIRLVYHLDAEMVISAEALRTLAVTLYSCRNSLPALAVRLQSLETPNTETATEPAKTATSEATVNGELLLALVQDFCQAEAAKITAGTKTPAEAQIPTQAAEAETPAEPLEDEAPIPEEILFLEETWEMHVAEFDDEEIVSSSGAASLPKPQTPPPVAPPVEESGEQVWEEATEPFWQNAPEYLKARHYFLPEIKVGSAVALQYLKKFGILAFRQGKNVYVKLRTHKAKLDAVIEATPPQTTESSTAAAGAVSATPEVNPAGQPSGADAAKQVVGTLKVLGQKSATYIKQRQYFIPESKLFGHWCYRHGKALVVWAADHGKRNGQKLVARQFFWPELRQGSVWVGVQTMRKFRWLREKQELFLSLTPYQGKVGYYTIAAQKFRKFRLNADCATALSKVCDFPPKEALRVVQGILKSESLAREDREQLTQVKDVLLIHEKLLTQPETILDVVNYGMKKFLKIARRLSHVTNVAKFNRHMEAYFVVTVEELVLDVPRQFRKEVDSCYAYGDLKRVLEKYPLFRLTSIQQYKSLKLIWLVKQILTEFERKPGNLNRLLNTYLGPCGEANLRTQLNKLLLTSYINEDIWQAVSKEKYLEGVLRVIKKLQQRKATQVNAKALHDLITAFLAGDGKFTFADFKASLNFVPEKLQRKLLAMVRQELQTKLVTAVAANLSQKGKYATRMEQLVRSLNDPRYQESGIMLFGYSPESFTQKIQEVTYQENGMEEWARRVFKKTEVPDSFFELLLHAKKAEAAAKEKTVANCVRMLRKIEESVAKREQIQLNKALVALFKINGDLNFAEPGTETIPGYKLANDITRFYRNPSRTTLDLSAGVVAEVREILKNLVDGERSKQLVRM